MLISLSFHISFPLISFSDCILTMRKDKLKLKKRRKKMKLMKKILAGGAVLGLLALTAGMEAESGETSYGGAIPGSNLVRSYNYSGGFLVGVYDGSSNTETIYSAGKMIKRVQRADDGDMTEDADGNAVPAEDVIVTVYNYERGSLQTSENLRTGEVTHYAGSQDKALYTINKEGKRTEEYNYDDAGFLRSVDEFGMVGEDGEEQYAQIGRRTYDSHGRVDKAYQLEDPSDANSGLIETSQYHYEGNALTKVTGRVWNEEDEKWIENSTTYYAGGRPTHSVNAEDGLTQKWHYDGTKLVYTEQFNFDEDKGAPVVNSRTYFDKHGRPSEMWDVEDGKEVGGDGGIPRQTWHYNDTNSEITTSYVVEHNGSKENKTATVGPGGLIKTVYNHNSATHDVEGGTWHISAHEHVTYYHYNDAQDTILENYNERFEADAPAGGGGGWEPTVVGILEDLVEIDGSWYAVVNADEIDLFDGDGFQAADGETFYVAVDSAAARDLSASVGDRVLLAGDVAQDTQGHLSTTMNREYGGGYAIGEENISSYLQAREGASWYKQVMDHMAQVWNSVEQEFGSYSSWRQGFEFLRDFVFG